MKITSSGLLISQLGVIDTTASWYVELPISAVEQQRSDEGWLVRLRRISRAALFAIATYSINFWE